MIMALVTASMILLAGLLGATRLIRQRNLHLWLGAYVRGLFRPRAKTAGPIHVMVCVADHFDPGWNTPTRDRETARVAEWSRRLPVLAGRHRDGDGMPFRYTFFYPEEQYRFEHLDRLAQLRRQGFADVEIHLHHDADTSEGVRATLEQFKTLLHTRHGLLHRNAMTGEIEYGFIHGNWALDNCAPDGRDCGVNDELVVLKETGCYADFTLPAAPADRQTRTINSIYYATDDPDRPKSHDSGVALRVGAEPTGDLLIIQGPLTLNWRRRAHGLLPRIENGELSGDNPPTPERADVWIRQGIHVAGRPEWVFVKLHTHGANEKNMEALLGSPMDRTLTYLERQYNDGQNWVLHYVTAREMFNIVKAAEAGLGGNPGRWRQYLDAMGVSRESATCAVH